MDACSSINHNSDARNIIDGRRREREEEEQRRHYDDRERFSIYNDQQRRDNRQDHRTPPRHSPPCQGEEPLGINGIRAFSAWLRQADWLSGFSPKGIKTYDGDRDPKAWLRVYTTSIKVAGVSENAMANYLPVVLSPTVQDWLTGLPENSINSWGDLCAKFIDNFHGTFTKLGVEWDLYQIHQKKIESLREFIQRFMKKKNTIPVSATQSLWHPSGKGSRIPTYSRSCQEDNR